MYVSEALPAASLSSSATVWAAERSTNGDEHPAVCTAYTLSIISAEHRTFGAFMVANDASLLLQRVHRRK